jgi:outer membrane protein TolC
VTLALVLLTGTGSAQVRPAARLTLDEAVGLALATSPSLAAGRGSLAVAAGSRKEIQAERLPDAGLGGTLWQYSDPMIYRPIHEFSAEDFPGFDRTLIQGEFQVGWTLFDGWIRARRLDQARALEASAGEQLSGRQQDVVAATVQAYVETLASREIVAAQDSRKAALQAEAERVARFLAEGRAARVEQLRASAALGGAEADRASAVARLEYAEASLARLTGLDRSAVRADGLEPIGPAARALPSRDSLLAVVRLKNPRLQAAASRIAAATAAHSAAKGAWFPSLRVEGRVVTYAAADYSATTEWQTGVRLYYPIYSIGGRSASVQRTEAMVTEAEGTYRELDQSIAAQLDDALARLTEANGQVAALGAAVAQWEEVVRTEALALREGAGTQTDYIRAEADLAGGRAQLARANGQYLVALVRLAQVTGQLTPETLRSIVERAQ